MQIFWQKLRNFFFNNSIFYKPIRSRDTLKMAPMITVGLTMRGKPNYRDKNNHGLTNKLLKIKATEKIEK